MLPLLSLTQSVLKSQDGTTCCGCAGTAKVRTILYVLGSMTSTELLPRFGTYTRGFARRVTAVSIPAPAWA
jgi:hypothetical protein